MKIGEKFVGQEHGCFIIAEIGQAHDGSLGAAHAYIDLAKKVGADAVKFQTHVATEESSRLDQFRVKVFPQDSSRFDYWQRTAFSGEQWNGLAKHARELGIIFFSSPFSNKAVEMLQKIDVPAWKIASGELNNYQLIKHLTSTKKPILLSSGMSTWSELDCAVDTINQSTTEFGIFQCTSTYPCPIEDIGINIMEEMATRYNVPVGLSDHSGSIFPSIVAVARGASMIEAHLVMSRDSFGPDTVASLTGSEVEMMVRGVRATDTLLRSKKDKDVMAEKQVQMKSLFGKSIYAKHDIKIGTVFDNSNVCLLKPGIGLRPIDLDKLLGREAKFEYSSGDLINIEETIGS